MLPIGAEFRITTDSAILERSGIVNYYYGIAGCKCVILEQSSTTRYKVRMLGGKQVDQIFYLYEDALLTDEEYLNLNTVEKSMIEKLNGPKELMGVPNGARKDDKGKPDFKYLQYVGRALAACCKVWEGGYIKYGEVGGWQRVDNGINRYKSALLRHELYYPSIGEVRDEELSEILGEDVLHATCVAVNALMVLELTLKQAKNLVKYDDNVSVPEVYDV